MLLTFAPSKGIWGNLKEFWIESPAAKQERWERAITCRMEEIEGVQLSLMEEKQNEEKQKELAQQLLGAVMV